MPEKRHARTRDTLPEGYQFGDMHRHYWRDFPQHPVTKLYPVLPGKWERQVIIYTGDGTTGRLIDWNDIERGEH